MCVYAGVHLALVYEVKLNLRMKVERTFAVYVVVGDFLIKLTASLSLYIKAYTHKNLTKMTIIDTLIYYFGKIASIIYVKIILA